MIYPEPEARDKIYQYPLTHVKTRSTFILASMNYFDSDISKSTNTVVYFDWKTGIYIYVCGICRTQFYLCCQIRADDNSSRCTFTTGKSVTCACANEILTNR